MGIIVHHYKHPYKTTSIMESKRVFFRGSNTTRLVRGGCVTKTSFERWLVLEFRANSSNDCGMIHKLVGRFNPSEQYARRIGSSPQGDAKIKKTSA